MFTRELGRTGEQVAVIGQGLTRTGGWDSASEVNDQNRVRVLRRGIELGMTLIDTAELYGGGHGEEVAARAIAGIRGSIFLTGKFNPGNASRDDLMLAAERSLKRLKTDHFDLYQVHWPNPAISHEETLRAMQELVTQGKVRNIGVCNFTRNQLIDARANTPDVVISSVQSEYNIYQRHVEREMLPYCITEGITLLAYSPLDSGLDHFGDPRMEKLESIAANYDASVQQLILRWILANEQVVVLVKTATIPHLESNARSVEIDISESDLLVIDQLFEQKVFDVDPRDVQILQSDGYRYRSIEEAQFNRECLIPSPETVAGNTAMGYMLQPVGVRVLEGPGSNRKYALADNEQLYWSWRLAHPDGAPMPAYIKHG